MIILPAVFRCEPSAYQGRESFNSHIMQKKSLLFIACSILFLVSCDEPETGFLSSLDPGSYDSTWWNREPIRLIQTNLPENRALMDIDAYVKSISDASANAVLLNVGGIVANYPTRLGNHYKNPFMKGDLAGELITRLQEKGIRVFGRFDFSKVNESIAAKNPGWLYVSGYGVNVSYNRQVHTCVNGGYQQEYAFRILTEALTDYPLDGIFFNMIGYQTTDYSGNYYGLCQCANCRDRYMEMTGSDLPESPDMAYRDFTWRTSRELFNRMHAHIREVAPGIVIKTYTDAGVDLITTESSSSLSTGYEWNYSGTGNVKPTLGSYRDLTASNLLIYFQAIGFRHVGTSPNIAKKWMLQNMLHAAPVTMVVIGTLEDYEDRVFFPVLHDLFGFHKDHGKLFTNVQSAARVGLVRGSGQEYRGLIKLLTEEHIMFDVIVPSAIGTGRMPRPLEDYEALVIGDLTGMDDVLVAEIDDYVRNGGRILATGFTSINDGSGNRRSTPGLRSLGITADYEIFPRDQSTYLKVSDHDKSAFGSEEFNDFSIMMLYSDFMKCLPAENAEGFLKLLPSTMYGPPEKCYFTEDEITGYPGVIVSSHGRGKSVFIPWQIGAQYEFKGNYAHRALFMASLENILGLGRTIETNASPLVEITHLVNLNEAFEWIGLINHSGQIGASFRDPVPINDINLRLKPSRPVREVRLARSGRKISFSQNNEGWLECTLPSIEDFEMVVCLYR